VVCLQGIKVQKVNRAFIKWLFNRLKERTRVHSSLVASLLADKSMLGKQITDGQLIEY
jgi:hypothetical protein